MYAFYMHHLFICCIGQFPLEQDQGIEMYCSPNEKLFSYHADDYDRSINEVIKAIK